MLGADMVFVGFQPGVASAAVDLGLDLGNIPTAITMDDGFAFLRNRALKRFGSRKPESGP
jgi:rsbT antagonist protein RsbS